MNRREIIRQLVVGTVSARTLISSAQAKEDSDLKEVQDTATAFKSKWHLLPDGTWTGEDVWAQRLQDWCIKNGELCCLAHGIDRTIHILTHQLSEKDHSFTASVFFRFVNESTVNNSYAGFRLGVRGRFDDFRSAIMTGQGLDAGITRKGQLFIGKQTSDEIISENQLKENIQLIFSYTPHLSGTATVQLKATDQKGKALAAITNNNHNSKDLKGNIALVSHFITEKEKTDLPTIAVRSFEVKGQKLAYYPDQVFGPIYFAQYSLHNKVLKLTAQLAPVDTPNVEAHLLVQEASGWKKLASVKIHPLARIATFRITNWNSKKTIPYRVTYSVALRNSKTREYAYEGTIAEEPVGKNNIKALACSCNWDYGFPDNEVVQNALKHKADLIFFLGDQFYEANGGFGIQTTPLQKACLDYLRKWYMFGWSYRNLFRHIPMAALPDDHDVYHGNIWGAGGRAASKEGNNDEQQDSGGYKMPADWVNMAQLTQTSHMPDPFDPAPVAQSISVYYTQWQYAGISFGIIEDRKFKTPPKEILPLEAEVRNGYAHNTAYNKDKVKELEAQLLGERQLNFLSHWIAQSESQIHFKVLISASPFCCLQTLPAGTKNDKITPTLSIPKKGEYVQGDLPTQDMDTNGWPHNRRDEVLTLLGKDLSLHLVGDQHLPSVVRYGIKEYGDSSFCFAVPALNNLWPRRWWPLVDELHQSLPGRPKYTGNFIDGFGNKMTVHAVANPHDSGLEPAMLYDRVTGYGVVEFDKAKKKITLHCWPRYADPTKGSGQYMGWPLIV